MLFIWILVGITVWIVLMVIAMMFFKGAYTIDNCNNDCNQGRTCNCRKKYDF
jgi:uncharacterized membrane protein